MILVRIFHYLSADGLMYFPSWFNDLYDIIKIQDGYFDITYRIDFHNFRTVILVIFSDEGKLMKWAKSQTHQDIISKLDLYRTQPWESERYDLNKT